MTNPLEQAKAVKREKTKPRAWDLVPESKASEEVDKPPKKQIVEVKKPAELKIKHRRTDYDNFKRTSVDVPEEMLHAWNRFCADNKVKKADHFFNWICGELKKAGYIE